MSDPVNIGIGGPNAALVLGPEDHLLVSLPAGTSMKEFDYFRNALAKRLQDRVTVVAGIEQMAVLPNAREGICGDESPHHSVNCSGNMPAICHLRFGHGSAWHESETGQRWKYGDYTSAFPGSPAPVERGPAHDPPPGRS